MARMGLSTLLTLLLTAACASPVQADALARLFRHMESDFRTINAWPYPHVIPDRQSVRTPFDIMTQNGRRRQNTLGEYHFQRDTADVTEAGWQKIRQVILKSPPQYRTVFVQRSADPSETAARVETVKKIAAQFMTEGGLPQVLVTNDGPAGWPADRIQTIDARYRDSAPDPRLPAPKKES